MLNGPMAREEPRAKQWTRPFFFSTSLSFFFPFFVTTRSKNSTPSSASREMCRRLGLRLLRRLSRARALPFVKKFTSKEIETATKGFSMILESSPHGTVYKARFPDGLVAAVRRARSQEQDNGVFHREVQLLGRLNHRNIVRLQGFSEGHSRFLVFDHMENGSLKECLHDPLRTPLNWRTRLQIAIDVAAALEYLYYFCDPPVFDVAVDSNYVMLDADYVAKLSGIGIIKYDLKGTAESNAVCFEENIRQRRRDLVFQYGVLILELVTGQSLGGEGELVQWVQESGFVCSMHRMVDADLGIAYDSKELQNLLIIARLCTKAGNDSLISMPQILRYLQGRVEPLRS